MLNVDQQLYRESELKRAKLAQLPVIVLYEDGEIADYDGSIEDIRRDSIKINGMYYTKAACRFYVR